METDEDRDRIRQTERDSLSLSVFPLVPRSARLWLPLHISLLTQHQTVPVWSTCPLCGQCSFDRDCSDVQHHHSDLICKSNKLHYQNKTKQMFRWRYNNIFAWASGYFVKPAAYYSLKELNRCACVCWVVKHLPCVQTWSHEVVRLRQAWTRRTHILSLCSVSASPVCCVSVVVHTCGVCCFCQPCLCWQVFIELCYIYKKIFYVIL